MKEKSAEILSALFFVIIHIFALFNVNFLVMYFFIVVSFSLSIEKIL